MKLIKLYHRLMRNFHMDLFLSMTDHQSSEYKKHKRKYEYHNERLFTLTYGR